MEGAGELQVDTLHPQLLRVSLTDRAARLGDESPALAQIRLARTAGAHLLVSVADTALLTATEIPEELRPLDARMERQSGEWSAGLQAWLERWLPAADGHCAAHPLPSFGPWTVAIGAKGVQCRALVGPPSRGGFTVWAHELDPALIQAWTKLLGDRAQSSELAGLLEQHMVAVARGVDRTSPADSIADRDLSVPPLEPADERSALHHEWRCERGGEWIVESARGLLHSPCVDIGRRVVRAESFALPAQSTPSAECREWVLVRRTHPRDFGKVLRVMLEDEDLGPWRLGAVARAGHWSEDLLRIPVDVWSGRHPGRLHLAPAENQDVVSFRFRWCTERIVDGSWLGDLEAENATGALTIDRSGDGVALRAGDRTSLRGLCTQVPAEITYRVPSGYEWFESWVGLDPSAPHGRVRFEVWVDGERRFRSDALAAFDPGMAARARLTANATLTLRCSAIEAHSCPSLQAIWLDPVLWRATPKEQRA